MIYGLYNIDDVLDTRYVMESCYPKGMFIPKDHHYNANNKRKKRKKK